jgi:hypothetical protein
LMIGLPKATAPLAMPLSLIMPIFVLKPSAAEPVPPSWMAPFLLAVATLAAGLMEATALRTMLLLLSMPILVTKLSSA